jgi:putative PIG3 family NAD(P)H quinone oxidoreductase
MRAIVVQDGKLLLGTAPDPSPRPGDLLVRVRAAGVNRADLLQALGRYPPPAGESEIIGLEIAGEVEWPAERRGERVMALLAGGGYAELARVPAAQAMPIPEGLPFEQAAAIPEAFLTSWLNLFMLGGLKPGETVVIHAAASGVGSAAVQLCKGVAGVILATASAGKLDECRKLGATHVLSREDVPRRLPEAVREAAGKGADLIFDMVGAAYLEANIAALGLHGRLCCISTMSGAKAALDLNAMLRQRLTVLGSTLRTRSAAQKAKLVKDFSEKALPRFARGELRPVLWRSFPLDQAAQAHEALQTNRVVGKAVLVPQG